jgi:small nuclear ribonucleoprotein (snRNP)-like protein
MTAEQIRSNQEKAAARAIDNAARREKSKHFLARFTTSFPVPPPLSSHTTAARSATGPLALLCSFCSRRIRVFVLIRRSHSVRSLLSAYLSAFDKHFNLLLSDVDEQFTEWQWRQCGANTVQRLTEEGVRFQLPKQQPRERPTTEAAAADSTHATSTAAAARPLLPFPTTTDSSSSPAAPLLPAAMPCAPAAAPLSSPPLLPLPGAPSLSSSSCRYVRVEVLKQRHVSQLYVRGDGVVSVSEFPPASPIAHPHT